MNYTKAEDLLIGNLTSRGTSMRHAKATVLLQRAKKLPGGKEKHAAIIAAQKELASAKVECSERQRKGRQTANAKKRVELEKELEIIDIDDAGVPDDVEPVTPAPEPTPVPVVEPTPAPEPVKQPVAAPVVEPVVAVPPSPAPAPEAPVAPEVTAPDETLPPAPATPEINA